MNNGIMCDMVKFEDKNYTKETVNKEISNWCHRSLVFQNGRVTLVNNNPFPFKIDMPSIDELKIYNYTGLEYLILATLQTGIEIGKNIK